MIVDPAIRLSDTFPALDFKFQNRGVSSELLTRVGVEVRSAEVDHTPSLEYSLSCRDGNLALMVSNYGWGDAKSFQARVDLSVLGAASPSNHVVVKADVLPSATAEGPRRPFPDTLNDLPGKDSPNMFKLVDHRQLDLKVLPAELLGDESWPSRHGYVIAPGYGKPRGGLRSLSGGVSYTYNDDQSRTQQIRAPSPHLIYVIGGRFEYVYYDDGIAACMMPPSYEYHFLLEPDQRRQKYEKSIAHQVGAGEFERIWLVLASTKSAFYDLRCYFRSGTGTVIESPLLRLHIWSPSNGPVNSYFMNELSDVDYPTDYRGRPIDLPDYNT